MLSSVTLFARAPHFIPAAPAPVVVDLKDHFLDDIGADLSEIIPAHNYPPGKFLLYQPEGTNPCAGRHKDARRMAQDLV